MVSRGMSSQPPTKEELETRLATAEVDGLREQLGSAQVENRLLRAKLDALVRRIFGKKSEQLSDAQLQLLLQDQAAPPPTQNKESYPVASETQAVGAGKEARRKTKVSVRRAPSTQPLCGV
jgi:hypothetical protein